MRILAGCFLLVALAGCARRAPPPETLRIVQTHEFASLNPVFVSGAGGQELAALLFSYLVKIDDRGRLVPDAALAVPTLANGGISRDGLTITYRLRPGIRYSDGSPLTSADVAATIAAILSPRSLAPSRIGFDDVARVETPSPATVVVRLHRRYAPIVLYLCGPGNAVPILPHGTLGPEPVGSGPYVVRRWARGDSLDLEANPRYFGGAPAIRHLTIRFVATANTALAALAARDADAFVNADEAQGLQFAAIPNIRVDAVALDGTGALIFNTQRLRDPRLRHALAQALDRRAIVDKSLSGAHRSDGSGRGLFQWAYDSRAFAMPAYDAAAAAAVLQPRHLALVLIVRNDRPSETSIATEIQAAERNVGVDVTIRAFPVAEIVAPNGPLYGGRFDLALFTFVGGFDPDVTDQFACSRIPPRGFNKSRYCNPALDRLMDSAAQTYDPTVRRKLYAAIERTLARDLPLDALYQAHTIDVFPTRLRGESVAVTGPFWNVAAWRLP